MTEPNKMLYNVDNLHVALQAYSPVSYLDLGITQRGVVEFKETHNGVVYYFTNQDQVEVFKNNPEKYEPQYGGFCTFGVNAGLKLRPDPNKFIVKGGKYFLFLYNLEIDAQHLWLDKDDHEGMILVTNDNWSKLKLTYN